MRLIYIRLMKLKLVGIFGFFPPAVQNQESEIATKQQGQKRQVVLVPLLVHHTCKNIKKLNLLAFSFSIICVFTKHSAKLATVLQNQCSCFGQDFYQFRTGYLAKCKQALSERGKPCTYLKYIVHMLVLSRTQKCIECILSFDLRHYGGLIYMETPSRQPREQVSAVIIQEHIYIGPVARQRNSHEDQTDRGHMLHLIANKVRR